MTLDLAQAWALAKAWYADRLSPDWEPREGDVAQEIFDSLGLTGPFWDLKA